MLKFKAELIGGPRDGETLEVYSTCTGIGFQVSQNGSVELKVQYELRLEEGQPVTNRDGHTLFDLVQGE